MLSETARLTMRPLRDADCGPFCRILADPRVHRPLLLSRGPRNREQFSAMFRERKNERMGNHPARLAITFRAGGAFLGSIGVYPVDMTRVGLTYWIDADCHGRGLGTEALKAFSPVALTAYGVRAIQANVAVENLPSIRALERESYVRSEEHTSELQSLMRISYAVFCLKKKQITKLKTHNR